MSATVRDELAGKPANEVEQSSKESVGRRQGPSGMRTSKTRAGHRTGEACQLGWIGPGSHRSATSNNRLRALDANKISNRTILHCEIFQVEHLQRVEIRQ
jgi:hypothetical protein